MARFTSFASPVSIPSTDSKWKIINETTSYTAKDGDKLALISVPSITFPDNPADGTVIIISDYQQRWTNNNVSITSQQTIDMEASPFILDHDLEYGFISFVYDKTNFNWGLLINFMGCKIPKVDASSTSTTADNTSITADNSNTNP